MDPAKVSALCFERRGTGPTMHKLPWALLFFGIVGKLACDLGHSTHQVPTQWLIRHLFFRHCWVNSHVTWDTAPTRCRPDGLTCSVIFWHYQALNTSRHLCPSAAQCRPSCLTGPTFGVLACGGRERKPRVLHWQWRGEDPKGAIVQRGERSEAVGVCGEDGLSEQPNPP